MNGSQATPATPSPAGGATPGSGGGSTPFNTAAGVPEYITNAASQGILGGQAIQSGLTKTADTLQSSEQDLNKGLTADTSSITGTATGLTQYFGYLSYDLLPRLLIGLACVIGIGIGLWMMGKEKAA